MVRTCFLMMAALIACGAAVASPAHAGQNGVARPGKGGNGSSSTKIPVRFKNIGAQPVQVNAQAGSTSSGGPALPQSGFYQADVPPGGFTASAKGVDNLITQTYQGTASKSPIYLYVQADDKATTITVAPAF